MHKQRRHWEEAEADFARALSRQLLRPDEWPDKRLHEYALDPDTRAAAPLITFLTEHIN
jgi:hypothetical protein